MVVDAAAVQDDPAENLGRLPLQKSLIPPTPHEAQLSSRVPRVAFPRLCRRPARKSQRPKRPLTDFYGLQDGVSTSAGCELSLGGWLRVSHTFDGLGHRLIQCVCPWQSFPRGVDLSR